MRLTPFIAAASMVAAVPGTAWAQAVDCSATGCEARLSADQLLGFISNAIAAKDYATARTALDALAQSPGRTFEARYLSGFIAAEEGDLDQAISQYRAILADDPSQTRVRLELARAYLRQGKNARADHHFKLAQADATLPPDIARVVRSARNIIRSQRAWTFNVDVGIAPDSNINSATDANGVTLYLGDQAVDFTLDDAARARSGTGQTGMVQAGLRLPVAKKTLLLADLDLNGTNYEGKGFDDYSAQLAIGPEFRVSDTISLSAQALGAARWYGANLATTQFGSRLAMQATLSSVARAGLQLDARRTNARFDSNYDGWQVGAYASLERVVSRNAIASATLFARRDWLRAVPYSNTEIGFSAGIGAELPWGFNVGTSLGASRALYDAPVALFSADPRRDWRLNARLTLGNRKLQYMGFSPSLTWSANRTDSAISYYRNERSRLRFGIARYF